MTEHTHNKSPGDPSPTRNGGVFLRAADVF
jgi:hypothetical protein